MKRLSLFIIVSAALLCVPASVFAQKITTRGWASLWRYEDGNSALAASPAAGRVVFMGNSITDNWLRFHSDFFASHGFIGRGISGQTTPQMLSRFRSDVVDAGASAVVILAGTNDIAGNSGDCSLEEIVGNIASMCDIALSGGVRVLLCSVLPAHRYGWAPSKRPDIEIPKLNALLKAYAESRDGVTYVDFFSAMVDTADPSNEGGLPPALAGDGVHPTLEGYAIMEKIVLNELAPELAAREAEQQGARLRLMSYNVRNCNGMDGESYDCRRVAETISSCCPDVVAVQELDSATVRSGGEFIIGKLAQYTGMHCVYAPAIAFDGGCYGVGLLCREEPVRYEYVSLPGREESRVLLMAEFSDYIYCCTHLSLTESDRLASVPIIEKALKKFAKGCGKPVFIAGDWNDTPDSALLAMMSRSFEILSDTSACTFPSPAPDCTIDYIARWKKSSSSALSEVVSRSVYCAPRASDHRPVGVSLK